MGANFTPSTEAGLTRYIEPTMINTGFGEKPDDSYNIRFALERLFAVRV